MYFEEIMTEENEYNIYKCMYVYIDRIYKLIIPQNINTSTDFQKYYLK